MTTSQCCGNCRWWTRGVCTVPLPPLRAGFDTIERETTAMAYWCVLWAKKQEEAA